MKETNRKKKDVTVYIIIAVLFLIALFSLFPFWYTLVGSFNDGLDYEYGGVWIFPRKFTLANYQVVLGDERLYRAFLNTFIIVGVGTSCSIIFTSIVSYAMSQPELKFKRFFRSANLFTMFFSGGIVPYYMVMVLLGLYDTFFVYLLPALYSVYNMIVLSSFFRGIDQGLREAAIVDGAREIRIWWSIYLPVSKPALATIALWVGVGLWNSYMSTLLYTSKAESMWTLQFYLMRVIQESQMPEMDGVVSEQVTTQTISFAAIIVSVIPIVLMYPLLAKFFTKGLMVGSLKG